MGLAFLFLRVDLDHPHISSKALQSFLVKSKLLDPDQIYAPLEFWMTRDHQQFAIYQKRGHGTLFQREALPQTSLQIPLQ